MTKFIIVERDSNLKDCGVFTGQVQIVDSKMVIDDVGALQVMDGVSSPDLEHAFLFNTAWDAWRFARQFQPIWCSEEQRFHGFRRWVARKDGDYFPGECRQGIDAHSPLMPGKNWIPQEAIIAATQMGYERGRESVFTEFGIDQREGRK